MDWGCCNADWRVEYLIIAGVSVLAVELFMRLPVKQAINELWRVSQKASRTVLSPHISDHWKEKVMLVYARKALTSTLKLAAIMSIFIVLALLPVFIVDFFGITEQSVLSLLGTTRGLVASTLIAACYFWLRGRLAR
jgi:hypothetical protein